ncbi:MAG: type II/IV secretion system protein [Phycisphaerae bacterium]|nr:type II/IV secretion system protein [Phycisphaerae bacterium]
MLYFLDNLGPLLAAAEGISDFITPEGVERGLLDFSPVRVVILIAWVYLCMYSMHRIEFGSLVAPRYKILANTFAIFIGPFILFVLYVANTTHRYQEGEIDFEDILHELAGSLLNWAPRNKRKTAVVQKAIELMDSSGKSFADVYGEQSGRENSEGRQIIQMAEEIILEAIHERASDILVDPKTTGDFVVRFRIDGFLSAARQIEPEKCAALVNSIKAVAHMDISEKRRPQDGSFMARIPEGSVYFRVASAGVMGGEKLSIRVLNQSAAMLGLEDIGLSDHNLKIVAGIANQPSGMVLVCGPTGSGKSTSLYAMLNTIDFYTRNVVTIEDPIEYVLPAVSQIEVNPKANITFANTLRSVLRQDPDVISVGEIRDGETAAMALQASQTGHLVLATLHASSNLAALVRLMDLGIKPLLLASAITVIISQRLVRRLCDKCKRPAELSPEEVEGFRRKGLDCSGVMEPGGCKGCRGTGFHGRTALVDIMTVNDQVKANLLDGQLGFGDLKLQGDEKGRSTLRKEGLRRVLEGVTTLEEVKRVTSNLG